MICLQPETVTPYRPTLFFFPGLGHTPIMSRSGISIALLIVLLTVCFGPGQALADQSQDQFDTVWADFSTHYAYFEHKNVDWDGLGAKARPGFQGLDGQAFAVALNRVLAQGLHDWHVWVRDPTGATYGLGEYESYELNYRATGFPAEMLEAYALPGTYQTLARGAVHHCMLPGDVAYVAVVSLTTEDYEGLGERDIHKIFRNYQNAKGLILDLRASNGGNELIARLFASHFTESELVYGYHQDRIPGPDRTALGPYQEHGLEPAPVEYRYTGQVICLVGKRCLSSAEWFALMLKTCPGVLLMGDTTRGGTGNPRTFGPLPNGVSYALSTWAGSDAGKMIFEDRGVMPQIPYAPDQSYTHSRDILLEQAVKRLREM